MKKYYGCYNRPDYPPEILLKGNTWVDGKPLIAIGTPLNFVFAMDCQYTKTDLGKSDPKCEKCKHKQIGDGK